MAFPKTLEWILISLILFEPVQADIIERPRNTLTAIGESTTFKCCSRSENAAFTWKRYTAGDLSHKICEGGKCPHDSNFAIEESVPECNDLVILSASGRDSALYQCVDGTGDTAAAYLITYICDASSSSEDDDLVVGDIFTFRCGVMWGNRKPQFHSYWKNEHGKVIKWNNFTEKQSNYVSTWTVSLQRPELEAFTWVLHFMISQNADGEIDTSTPVAAWTSKKKRVAYPVTGIQTSCQDNACQQVVGDSITCSADGYPSPELFWLDRDGKEIGLGPTLTLNSTGKQKYQCVATNTIRGVQQRDSVSIVVFIDEPERSSTPESSTIYLKVISGEGALMLIIIFISSMVYLFHHSANTRLQTVLSADQNPEPGISHEVCDNFPDHDKDPAGIQKFRTRGACPDEDEDDTKSGLLDSKTTQMGDSNVIEMIE